ncbi:ABC transporter [Catenovulum agarivorans DS-2]|uniref:ABC transporter n=1 Tax=Catenovulum agarivorans DS-2 TaxID=1328313 RepID=W7QRX6_9ALTE|nr:ABC transporter permease [Catenovulum agarivorans]EWH10593.1 ABC transporter [Catenovulum agarivorans DS-2]
MIRQAIHKELISIGKDPHSLAVLILMPLVFMLLMSFAMSERQSQVVAKIPVYFAATQTPSEQLFTKYLFQFGYQQADSAQSAKVTISFINNIEKNLFANSPKAIIEYAAVDKISPQINNLVLQHLQMSLAKLKLHLYSADIGDLDPNQDIDQQIQLIQQRTDTLPLIRQTNQQQAGHSVLNQTVPAWLVFGIYFIVLPISLTLLSEKQNSTLTRLRMFPTNLNYFFLLKQVSYFAISMAQYSLLLAVGLFIVPVVMQQPMYTAADFVSLLPLSLVICSSAVAFACVLAVVINSFEQAIVIGGGLNILLAAISGFMVPHDIMPTALQTIANFSPMFWAAELVRSSLSGQGGQLMTQQITYLVAFTLVCLCIAVYLFNRRSRRLMWN